MSWTKNQNSSYEINRTRSSRSHHYSQSTSDDDPRHDLYALQGNYRRNLRTSNSFTAPVHKSDFYHNKKSSQFITRQHSETNKQKYNTLQ